MTELPPPVASLINNYYSPPTTSAIEPVQLLWGLPAGRQGWGAGSH